MVIWEGIQTRTGHGRTLASAEEGAVAHACMVSNLWHLASYIREGRAESVT